MKKLNVEEYINALDSFLERYVCPNCKPTDKEQGFIDGVSYCKHVVRFYAEEEGYEQISLEDYMRGAAMNDKDQVNITINLELSEQGKRLLDALRPKGEWQITDAYPHNVYCSECHKKFAQTHWEVWEDGSLPRNFCPNCGADMRGNYE